MPRLKKIRRDWAAGREELHQEHLHTFGRIVASATSRHYGERLFWGKTTAANSRHQKNIFFPQIDVFFYEANF